MKKMALVLMIMMQNYCWSMESIAFYTCDTTNINLQQGCQYIADRRVDFVVFEKNEQQLLQESLFNQWLVGDVFVFNKKLVHINKNDTQQLHCKAIGVVEPLLMADEKNGRCFYSYYAEQKNNQGGTFGVAYYGVVDRLPRKILYDLALCYNRVLMVGLKQRRLDMQNKAKVRQHTIALPAIATARGFPRNIAAIVAVRTILMFIKNNPDVYSCIELFVRTQAEFEWYRDLLGHYLGC
jgi:hypothetical protein